MKILVTFEHGGIPIHCIDFLQVLKYRGHEIHFFKSSLDSLNDPHGIFLQNFVVLNNPPQYDLYDIWFYDVTSWEEQNSPFIPFMESFKGKLVCINYEDGYDFFLRRVSSLVVEKTLFYINNTLRKDKSKYPPFVQERLFLSTSYITNSQDFKNVSVPFLNKKRRAIFTGSITGLSESGDPEELKCRIKIPMALINAGIECFYQIYQADPSYQHILSNVPGEYKKPFLERNQFIQETVNSMVILALRGNGYTVNRFFEGLASGGLVFSTKFNHAAEFVGCGESGIHYVEIKWDGSDVVEKIQYYFNHLDEAEIIATNGRKLWEEYSMLDENKNLPKKVIDYYIDGMNKYGLGI